MFASITGPASPGQTLRSSQSTAFQVSHTTIHLNTKESIQFIDLTEKMQHLVTASGLSHGIINIQTQHTTTAIIINEHEPLLLEDMQEALLRLAPQQAYYRHNDFAIRTANMTPEECPNGHAHCQSLVLSSSATLNVVDGAIQLGRWQRIFFLELDHARPRQVSIMIMGQATLSEYD